MKKLFTTILIISIIIKTAVSIDCNVKDELNVESKLKYKLFCNGYDRIMRPVQDHKTTTSVKVKMLIKSYDYSDEDSTLTINAWMINEWKDEYLKWDSREYSDMKSIDVGSNLIWRPDFSLYNADISYGIGSCHETNCLIESDGNVTCVEPCSFVGHCRSDYTLWPFDKQNCSMLFGPWMNGQNEVDFIESDAKISKSGAAEHTQWKLVSAKVFKKVVALSSKDKKYSARFPNLTYFFVIERHSSLVFQILKVAGITFFLMNMTSLFIKTRMNERLTLLILSLYLHFQMIHQMSWITPHNGEQTPNVLLFYRNSLAMTCVLIIESLIVDSLNISEANPTNRLKNAIDYIRRNQFISILFNNRGNFHDDDDVVLVEEQPQQQQVTRKVSPDNEFWTFLANLIDKLFLIIYFMAYIFMIFILFPLTYILTKNTIQEET